MKRIFCLLVLLFLLAVPLMAAQVTQHPSGTAEPAKEQSNIDKFGVEAFSYLGEACMLPVRVLEKSIRTLLFMDHN